MATAKPEVKSITEALSRLQTEMKQPVKNCVNPHFKNKYADLGACVDAVRSHFSELGLAFTQSTEIKDTGHMLLVTTIRHVSGETISGQYLLNPEKNNPQGMGSALTYARRYALCSMLGIVADEDDDGNAASQGKTETKAKPKEQPKPESDTAEKRAKEAADKYIDRISKAKDFATIDAIMFEVNNGKLQQFFPDLYQGIVDESQAQADYIARNNHVENTVEQMDKKEIK